MEPFTEIKILEEEPIEWLGGGENEFGLDPGYLSGRGDGQLSLSPDSIQCYVSIWLPLVHRICYPCKKAEVRRSPFSTFQVITQEEVWERQHQSA